MDLMLYLELYVIQYYIVLLYVSHCIVRNDNGEWCVGRGNDTPNK